MALIINIKYYKILTDRLFRDGSNDIILVFLDNFDSANKDQECHRGVLKEPDV